MIMHMYMSQVYTAHTNKHTHIYIYIYIYASTFVDKYCRIMCIHKHIYAWINKIHTFAQYIHKNDTPQTSIYPPPYSTVAASTCRIIVSFNEPLHPKVRTSIYIHTYIHTYGIHTYIRHTYIHTYGIHTYIHTYVYTYIHTLISQ